MNKATFLRNVGNAIEHYIDTGSNEKFTLALRHKMKIVWEDWAEQEEDWRNGEETYGYPNKESVEYYIHYISDRWRCAFRLKWLIDGLENGSI